MSLLDENDAVLRDLAASGSDLTQPRLVDFSYIFPNQTSADRFAAVARTGDFSLNVEKVEAAEFSWDVTASKAMLPTCENITAAEELLNALAKEYGGFADGWGFLSN